MEFHVALLTGTLENIPAVIETYFRNIPENALDIRRTKEAWTIREHLYHIVSVQEMLLKRMEKIRDEEQPVIAPYFPENQKKQDRLYGSVEAAFSEYGSMRKKQIELIESLAAKDLSKEASHAEYLSYNIPIIVNHMIFHEYWHMYRIEELWLTRDEYLN
jgi:uncharacterized damage-inducible protein DinB